MEVMSDTLDATGVGMVGQEALSAGEAKPSGETRPLVTFALFAYNQERYVREAIEGAFSQTYDPLEIILSDDCSSDRTFEIMQEVAAVYSGRHRIILRRSAINVGTARHVQEVFASSSGSLFVVAAGDDISAPNRVSALFAAWCAAGQPPGVVHSGWEAFRVGANAASRVYPPKGKGTGSVLASYANSNWLPAAAPTVAYTRHVFELFPPLSGGSIIEDAPLFLRAALVGRFVPCGDALVRLRIHDDNTGSGHSASSAARWNRFLQSKMIAFRDMQSDLARWDGEIPDSLRVQIERRILGVLRSISGLFVSQSGRVGIVEKARLVASIATAPAISSSLRDRLEFALTFFDFRFHIKFKRLLLRLAGVDVRNRL